ncbi:MAG: MFS transporter [Thaumarchaeota archaeon]|nr:MFS transporter [Nitrososphaerota archaeon]
MRDSFRFLPLAVLPTFTYALFRFSIGVIIPDFERVYKVSDPVAGVLLSAYIGCITMGVILAGYIAAKYGEVRTIIIGLVLFSIPIAGLTFSSGLPAFSLLLLVGAVGAGIMTTPTYSLAASVLSRRKGTAISLVTASFNVGGLMGPALTGVMLAVYGWPSPFSALGVVGGAVCLLFLGSYRGMRQYEGRTENVGRSFRSMMGRRSLVVLAAANFFADLGFVAYTSWILKFLIATFDVRGGSVVFIDSTFGVAIGLGGIGVLLAGMLFDRIGGRKASLLGGFATTVLTFILFSTNSLLSAIWLVVATGFVFNWFWVLLTSMAQANVDRESQSLAISFVQTAGFVGAFLGPGLAGLMGGESGVTSASLIATVTVPYLAYSVILLLAYRDPSKRG